MPNWNNATGASGNIAGALDSNGLPTSATVTWNAPGTWQLPDTTLGTNISGGANPAVMRGYLDFPGTGIGSTTTVSVVNLTLQGPYDVVIYFDGSNDAVWRRADSA